MGGAVNERSVGSAGPTLPERRLSAIVRDLQAARRAGIRRVVLAGGEPLLRRDLGKLLGAATRLGLSCGLATNGHMLLYPRTRRRLLDRGVDYLRFSLHGSSAQVHDTLVGVDGAFAQARAALEAWLREAPGDTRVDVACTLTSTNLDQLPALVELLAAMTGEVRPGLRLVAPRAGLAAQLWPPLDATRRQLGALLSGDEKIPLAWEGLPDCALEDHLRHRLEDLRRELPAFGPGGMTGGALPREDPGHRSFPPPCQRCARRDRCAGAPTWLLEEQGDGALRPREPRLDALVANSFNFELQHTLPGHVAINPASCPARELDLGGDPARFLLLERRGTLSLYASPTRDFEPDLIRRVKEETEQLYLDTSPDAAMGKLARHVRRVRAHNLCRCCEARGSCCGAATVRPGDPFEAQERWLRDQLEELRGQVLDVGCGEQPYRDQIAALVQAGEVEYHGLDPDGDALEVLANSSLHGTLHHCRVEDFSAPEGRFHWVLALRTLNHMDDLQRALGVICAVLRPGGKLLLSDMTVYGLLRTPHQVTAADHRGHGQEHFRNWDSHQVLALCEGQPLDLLVHQPVTPETSNEWFLLLERRP